MANFLGPNYGVANADGNRSFFNVTTIPLAQSFIASGNQELDQIIIWGSKSGLPAGNVVIEIYDDAAGVPSVTGPVNNISAAVSATTFPASTGPMTFTFSPRPQLLDGHKYHMVVRPLGVLSGTDYIQWAVDTSTPGFTGGNFSVGSAGGTWTPVTEDGIFEVYYFVQTAPPTIGDALAVLGDPPLDCRAQQVWLKSLVNALSSFYPSILPPLYGGTGVGEFSVGDMLYATAPFHLERLGIGSPGQGLGVSPAGLPAWGANGSNIVLSLRNDFASALNPGDVAVFALTGGMPQSVNVTTKIADRLFAGVAQEIINPGAFGAVMIEGVTQVRIQGSVTSGDYMDTSSTVRRASSVQYGPMKALQTGGSGSLIYAYINPALAWTPYTRFAQVDAFNVNGLTLTMATWTACPLNTTDHNSHPGLYSLAGNQITFNQTGTYRIAARVPLTILTSTLTSSLLRIRKTNGTPADLLVGESSFTLSPANTSGQIQLLGDVVITAGDITELQVQVTSGGAGTHRVGSAHGFAGFSNRYSVLEIWKVKN